MGSEKINKFAMFAMNCPQTFRNHSSARRQHGSWLRAVVLCSFALTCSVAQALEPISSANQSTAAVTPPLQVGEVSLVLGKAYRYDIEGDRSRVERGAKVSVSDRLVTESNGHVHVRFVDDALVSVRPNSSLEIQRYDYNSERPELSAVKFNLTEGVARAISGEAAKSARDRFRLNTPVAAIGVRGTDFVVSTDGETTRALVNEGVIVLAPFSEACSADALGPCVADALELSGESLQMLAVDQSASVPRLLPVETLSNQDMAQEQARQTISNQTEAAPVQEPIQQALQADSEPEQASTNKLILEGSSTLAVNTDVQAAADEIAAQSEVNGPVEDPLEQSEVPPLVIDFTPELPVSLADVGSRQLVWGRFLSAPIETDRLVLPFGDASADREITVGTLDYGLFRIEEGEKRVQSGLGVVGFQLSSAQAVYNSDTGIVAMQVNGGSLDIDFMENVFATQLNLNHELTGDVDIIANGRLFDGGFLRAIEETQRVTGAVSLDGSEAGYLFERQLEEGSVSGLTLWDSQ